jgi:hypothetical protein
MCFTVHQKKVHLLGGRLGAIFALILMPSLITFSLILANIIIDYLISISSIENVQQNLHTAILSTNALSVVEILSILFMFVAYPLLTHWRFYEREDFKGLVQEFRLVKKTVLISFILIAGISLLSIVNQLLPNVQSNNLTELSTSNQSPELAQENATVTGDNLTELSTSNQSPELAQENKIATEDLFEKCIGFTKIPTFRLFCVGAKLPELIDVNSRIFNSISIVSALVFYAGILKIITFVIRKDFRFYFARGCINLSSDEKDEAEKMRYVSLGLKSYNKYIEKRLNLTILELPSILAKISSLEGNLKDKEIDSFGQSFNEKLEPIRYLLSFSSHKDLSKFLTGEVMKPVTEVIKDYGLWLTTVIPAVIVIIQFILNPSSPAK